MQLLRSIQKCTKKIAKGLKTCTGNSNSSKTNPCPPLELSLSSFGNESETTEQKASREKLARVMQQSEKKQRRIQDVRVTIIDHPQENALSAEEQEKLALCCTTLGQLPQLTDLTIRGQPTSTNGNTDDNTRASLPRLRMNDLAFILRGSIDHLQTLALRNLTLVAEDSSEMDDLMKLVGVLQAIHRIELHHCHFDTRQMKEGQGKQHAPAWDELIQKCAELPNLVTLHLVTASATEEEMCHRPKIHATTLKQFYNHASLRDLKLEGYAIQANHIQALQAGSNAVVSKLRTLSLECSWNTDTLHALALYVQQQSSLKELNLTMTEEHNHTTKKDEKSYPLLAFRNINLAASSNPTSSESSAPPTTTNHANGPLAVLIRSLAHTHLTRVGLHVPKQYLQSIPRETWQFLWEYNSILQDLQAPGLSQQIQDDNAFWSNLNKAGRCNLSKTDRVHPDVLVKVLAHPDTIDSVQGLYYFLSATHPCLIR